MTIRRPRILLIHRYYHPDAPPYAHMLRTIAGWLKAEGFDVTVVSAQPSYNEATASVQLPKYRLEDGIRVLRLRVVRERKHQVIRRSFNHVWFLARVFWIIVRRRDELVTCSTMPPVLMGAAVRIALRMTGRRGRYIYHCQDLYPEALSGYDEARAPFWIRLLQRVDSTTVNEAATTLVLSRDMAATLRQRGVAGARIEVLNNFPLVGVRDADAALPPDVAAAFDTDVPVLLFAGNIGRFQGLEAVIDGFTRSSCTVRMVFMGDGAMRRQLQEQVRDHGITDRVWFLDYQPPAVAMAAMMQADHGLVTLRPGITRVAYPSKTTAYLTAGTPLLVVADGASALAIDLAEAGVATWVPPDDPDRFGEALPELSPTPPERRRFVQAYAERTFGQDVSRARWVSMLEHLTSPETAIV